jgi:hypothetical protein
MLPSVNDLFASLRVLMNEKGDVFLNIGLYQFRAFVVILICWFGIQTMATGSVDKGKAQSLLAKISIGFMMVLYFSGPIPGFGVSFSGVITDQATTLANMLNEGLADKIIAHLNLIYWSMETPGLSLAINIMEAFKWAVIIVALVCSYAVLLFVSGFGFIATAIGILVGPLLIPWFIVPEMEWLFWGWLRAFIQYSLYAVFANAYLFVGGNLLINFLDHAGSDWSAEQIAVRFVPLITSLTIFILGMVLVPSMANSYISGKAGEMIGPWR